MRWNWWITCGLFMSGTVLLNPDVLPGQPPGGPGGFGSGRGFGRGPSGDSAPGGGQPGQFGSPGGTSGFGRGMSGRSFGRSPGGESSSGSSGRGFGRDPSSGGGQPGQFGPPGGMSGFGRGMSGSGFGRGPEGGPSPGQFGPPGSSGRGFGRGPEGGPPPGQFGPPGSSGGYGRGMGSSGYGSREQDPERVWGMMVTATKGDNTINFDNMTPEMKGFIRQRIEQSGGLPMPDSGQWTKDQFMEYFARSREASASRMSGGGDPGRSGWDPSRSGWGGPSGSFDRGSFGQRGSRDQQKEEPELVAIRFGKLPKTAPSFFLEYDTNQDGQIGLDEWRKKNGDVDEFKRLDLNRDGLLTVEEYAQFVREETAREKQSASENGDDRAASRPGRIGGPMLGGTDNSSDRSKGGFGSRGSGMPGSRGARPDSGSGSRSDSSSKKDERGSSGYRGGFGGGSKRDRKGP